MRHAIAVLVLVSGCSDSGSGPTLELTPGPAATVTEGNLLQLAARDPDGQTVELAIDDAVAALFAVHELVDTDHSAILTLVPACGALAGASSGTVAMTLRAGDHQAMLSIQIVADPSGVCAGAPEHAITHATLQVADLADGGNVLCTRTSALVHSVRDPAREVLRTSASVPNHVVAADGHMVCGNDAVMLDVWPPTDAPALEPIRVETFSCNTEGCDSAASACCDAHADRLTSLTTTMFDVPVRSESEFMDPVDGQTIACADLDHNGTPELILAGRNAMLTTELGGDQRFVQQQVTMHANGLLAFTWQSSATTVEPVVLGGFGTTIMRAQVDGTTMSWVQDAQFAFATSDNASDPAAPDAILPVPTTPNGAARYVARLSGNLLLTCVSPACTAGTTPIAIDVSSWVPSTIGLADTNGDGSEDIVVTYRPAIPNLGGGNPVRIRALQMAWGVTPSVTSAVDLATFDVAQLGTRIVGVPSDTACDRIFALSGETEVHELTATACGSSPAYDHHLVPTPNQVYSIGTVNQRVIIATALGMLELTHATDTATNVRQVDPLLQELLATSGAALIDPDASNYGQTFVPCFAATSSIAFQVKRGGFVWAEIDAAVEGFTEP